jgi:outer membrane immunogenic protein
VNLGWDWGGNSIDTSATNVFLHDATFVNQVASANASAVGTTHEFSNHNDGFIGGGQFGWNWAFTNFVAGFEADIQGDTKREHGLFSGVTVFNPALVTIGGGCDVITCSIGTLQSVSKEVDWLGTVRGRLGWLATPTLLVYGTGGLAYGGVKATNSIFQTYETPLGSVATNFGGFFSHSQTRAGWTAGAGLEWMAGPQVSVKFEYLYYDLGDVTFNGPLVSPTTDGSGPYFINNVQTTTRFNGNIVRFGVNYHFGGYGAPLVAQY